MKKHNRTVTAITSLGEEQLIFNKLSGFEEIGRLFEFKVKLLRDQKLGNVDINKILGQSLTVKLDLPNGENRYFNGEVVEFEHTGLQNRYSCFCAVLRPWLWYLTLNSDCRIFQEKTVIDIIKSVLDKYSFANVEYKLEDEYSLLEYCVQYRESDFDFISRLMEHNGIFYYFEHQNDHHTLVISDSSNAWKSVNGYQTIPYFPEGNSDRRERDHISQWLQEGQVTAGKYVLRDFDFESPSTDLTTKRHNPGKYSHSGQEVYDYPGLYTKLEVGNRLVDKRLEEKQLRFSVKYGQGNAAALIPGMKFKLQNFYFDEENIDHVVISANYLITGDEMASGMEASAEIFQCQFKAIDANQNFRVNRSVEKPVIVGSQTAIVVGKSGEEIWTDKYGRVKVQFHWDRNGNSDEKSSCWLRVSHPMAGKKWGWFSVPRIGQEVIVSFLEGNPDRPLITGQVYNGEQMPPYDLPAHQTRSGIKTHSSKEGVADNFNEIRFEDKKGEEELYIHAERDCNRVVENNDTLEVGFEKKEQGDQTIDIYNDRTVTLDQGTDTLTIKMGDQLVNIKQGDSTLKVELGDHLIDVGAGKSTITAMTSIELKVGCNSIKIDQAGITIQGLQISIEGTTTADIKSPVTTVKGDGMLTLKGGITMIN